MKKTLFLAMALSLCSLANARVCIVTTFNLLGLYGTNVDVDVMGCEKGDELRFLPNQWGNEQLPLLFASENCDMNKAIIYNNSGVICTYAGRKELVDGRALLTEKKYKKTYEMASSGGKEWRESDRNSYWRISKRVGTEPIKEGDRIQASWTECEHSYALNAENRGKAQDFNPFFVENESILLSLGASYGDELEVVSKTSHSFVTYKKAPEPPKKAKKAKKML